MRIYIFILFLLCRSPPWWMQHWKDLSLRRWPMEVVQGRGWLFPGVIVQSLVFCLEPTCLLPERPFPFLLSALYAQQHLDTCFSLSEQECFYYPRTGFGSCQSHLDPEGSCSASLYYQARWLFLTGHVQFPWWAGLSLTQPRPWTRCLQHLCGFSSLPPPMLSDLTLALSGEKQCSGNPPAPWKVMFEMQQIPRSAVTLVSLYILHLFSPLYFDVFSCWPMQGTSCLCKQRSLPISTD